MGRERSCVSPCAGDKEARLLQVRRKDLFRINTLLIWGKDIRGSGGERRRSGAQGRRPRSSLGRGPAPLSRCISPRAQTRQRWSCRCRCGLTPPRARERFPSRALGQLLWFYKRSDIGLRCGVGLGWFENLLWVQESELRPGTPCGAQVGTRTNAQAPSQRLSDLLGPARPAQGQQLLISMVLGGKVRSSLSSAAQHGKR